MTNPMKETGYRIGGASGNSIMDPDGNMTGYRLGGASGKEILGPVGTLLVIDTPWEKDVEPPEPPLPRRREAIMATREKRAQKNGK